jgi:hypothetical protein
MRIRRWWHTAVLAVSFGCAGTPQTDPPNTRVTDPPDAPAPELDGEHLELEPTTRGPSGPARVLVGSAGAVSPPAATVHLTNLDSTDAPVEAEANADGSFRIEFGAELGAQLRLQVRADGQRSEPLDLVVDAGGLVPFVPELGCWTTDPEFELELVGPSSAPIELFNDCAQPLVVAGVALRTTSSPFLVSAAASELAPDSSAQVTVSYAPTESSVSEEVLLIEVGAPAVDRRSITLIGAPQ